MSARCRYHSAAALPTRLDVATSTRPLILSGWSIATLIATVPPREKPAMSARSTPIESMSATRSVPSWRSVPLPRPAVVSPCPLRSYSTTRWCSIRSGNVRRHALWSSARPWIKIKVSPRPASNHATTMSLQRARMFTQHLAVALARARQGKLVQAEDPLRPLVPGQPALFEKSVELLLCQVPDDESDRDLAEVRVWPPDNADVYHRWMCPQHRLDLVWVDVGAAPDDDVLDPAGHVQISRVVDEAEVAHVRPAVGRIGTEFLAPVAILHEVASHTDFSNAAADSVGRWAFEDLPLCAIVRPPHRGPAKSLRVGGARHSKLAGVHRAVEARDRNAGRGLPTLRDLRGQRRAGDRNRAQRPRCAKRVVEHPDHVGRHADQHGSPRPVCDVETMLGSPVRLAKHDKSCAHAKTVKAHAADALGEGRHRKHAIVLRDLESRREALECDLLEAGRQRRELRHAGRARCHRYLDDPIRIGIRRGRLGRPCVREVIHVGAREGENGPGFLIQPAQLVLPKAHRQWEDHRTEVGDRELERDVLPHVRQLDADDIAGPHASRAEEALETAHAPEKLLELDLAAVPNGGGVRTATRVPLQVADRVVRLPHRIKAMIRSGVSGSVTSERDNASAIAFATAAVAPIVPPSPTPLVPSSCTVDGVTRCLISTEGTSLALGMR